MTVLHSLQPPKPGVTNYVDQLRQGAAAEVRLTYFSWWRALTGRYDVVHVHWPERMVRDRSRFRQLGKRRAFDLLLLRTAVRRTPLVWTAHNLEPHEAGPAAERRTLRRFLRRVDLAVRLNPTTELPAGMAGRTIPHGHYRSRFASYGTRRSESGRLLYFGIIRPYKGVDTLLAAFRALSGPELRLRVVGDPHPGQRELVAAAEAADPRVGSDLRFVADDVLVEEVLRAQLVVLPYREQMHNSGSVLVALSLGRPVLVPTSAANQALADEVGPGWVLQYDGPLTADVLDAALRGTADQDGRDRPRLEGRDWDVVGEQHYQAYLDVLDRRRRR